jgi:hypothetical protein
LVPVTAAVSSPTKAGAKRIGTTRATPGTAATSSAIVGGRPTIPKSSVMMMKSPRKPESSALLIDWRTDEFSTRKKATRPTPIIRAKAVDAERRGLRTALSRASSPDTPRSRATGAPSTRATGRASTGLISSMPASTPNTPMPTYAGVVPRAPATTRNRDRARITTPRTSRTRERALVSTATSRMAARGGTRDARQAGMSAENRVTRMPTARPAITERGRIASDESGSPRKPDSAKATRIPSR